MAGTDALTGARYPGSADSPNVFQDIQNAVNDLSDIVGGIFTTNSARDTAFSTWVSQGNTMRDGLKCRVAGYDQIYRGGSWHGVTPSIVSIGAADATLYTASHTVMTLAVPDPLFSYKLLCNAQVYLTQVGVGCRVEPYIQVNGANTPSLGYGFQNATGATTSVAISATGAVSPTLTGASSVTLLIALTGPAGNGFQAASSSLYNLMSALVVPA